MKLMILQSSILLHIAVRTRLFREAAADSIEDLFQMLTEFMDNPANLILALKKHVAKKSDPKIRAMEKIWFERVFLRSRESNY